MSPVVPKSDAPLIEPYNRSEVKEPSLNTLENLANAAITIPKKVVLLYTQTSQNPIIAAEKLMFLGRTRSQSILKVSAWSFKTKLKDKQTQKRRPEAAFLLPLHF